MGTPKEHEACFGFVAGFSRFPSALDWLADRIRTEWCGDLVASPRFEFTETSYYEKQMGSNLLKQLWLLNMDFDPAALPSLKNQSNRWENDFRDHPPQNTSSESVERPLNIDPGYLSMSKLVLASTKNRAHRIYLDAGIYAEISLKFIRDSWEPWPWTYDDYRRADYLEFFNLGREQLKQYIRNKQYE